MGGNESVNQSRQPRPSVRPVRPIDRNRIESNTGFKPFTYLQASCVDSVLLPWDLKPAQNHDGGPLLDEATGSSSSSD